MDTHRGYQYRLFCEFEDQMEKSPHIIFFDGHCGLCNRFVNILIKIDRKHKFKFAPIQSKTGGEYLDDKIKLDLSTIIVLTNGEFYYKSRAVYKIINRIGGMFLIFNILKIFPWSWLDKIYDQVSKNRYRVFGRRDICRIPNEKEKERFLP